MTDAKRQVELVRVYTLQKSDEARLGYLAYLKRCRDEGDKVAGDALQKCVTSWLAT